MWWRNTFRTVVILLAHVTCKVGFFGTEFIAANEFHDSLLNAMHCRESLIYLSISTHLVSLRSGSSRHKWLTITRLEREQLYLWPPQH